MAPLRTGARRRCHHAQNSLACDDRITLPPASCHGGYRRGIFSSRRAYFCVHCGKDGTGARHRCHDGAGSAGMCPPSASCHGVKRRGIFSSRRAYIDVPCGADDTGAQRRCHHAQNSLACDDRITLPPASCHGGYRRGIFSSRRAYIDVPCGKDGTGARRRCHDGGGRRRNT